jgi:hypothetical protein
VILFQEEEKSYKNNTFLDSLNKITILVGVQNIYFSSDKGLEYKNYLFFYTFFMKIKDAIQKKRVGDRLRRIE